MKKVIVSGAVITALSLLIYAFQGENNFLVNGVREAFSPCLTMASQIKYNLKLNSLSKEKLQAENEILKREIMSYKDSYRYKQEVERLEALLSTKKALENYAETVAAKVISCKKTDSIIINKGKNSGIKKGDAVIAINGVVGRVTDTGDEYSVVSTLSSPDVAVSVRIVRTGKPAVTEGDGELSKTGLCKMTFIEGPDSVNSGDFIETWGGVVFPEGVPVGRVKEVMYENSVAYATVTPVTAVSGLFEVLVICR